MPRKQKRIAKKIWHEVDTHDRWVISYADFITLLFAFFVTLYAVSNINDENYNIVADSLGLAFLDIPPLSYPVKASKVAIQEPVNSDQPNGQMGRGALTPHFLTRPNYSEVTPDIREELDALTKDGLIDTKETEDWLEITLNTKVLFGTGSAQLLPEAKEIMKPLVAILQNISAPIQVEGFSDTSPIKNEIYPSNWELSAARAAAVVRKFVDYKLPQERFIVVGYGSNYPIASNKTEIGRELNRRVVLLITKSSRIRRLAKNTFVEKDKALSQKQLQEKLMNHKPSELKQFRLPDGRVRFTTVPGRQGDGNSPTEQ